MERILAKFESTQPMQIAAPAHQGKHHYLQNSWLTQLLIIMVIRLKRWAVSVGVENQQATHDACESALISAPMAFRN